MLNKLIKRRLILHSTLLRILTSESPIYANLKINNALCSVSELKKELEKKGLPTDELKADLVNRLQVWLDEEKFEFDDNTVTAPATTNTIESVPAVTSDQCAELPSKKIVP